MTDIYEGDGWRCEWEWQGSGGGPGLAPESYREPIPGTVVLTDQRAFLDAHGEHALAKFEFDPEWWASAELRDLHDEGPDNYDPSDLRRCGFD